MKRISIDPITRLEGHGKIEIFLDDAGDVENAYFQVPELRGFEQFVVGRHAEDMPVITNRICGVCPEAHHIAAVKALDVLFAVEPPRAAQLIRELVYCAFFVTDHTTHFYALGGVDLLVGPDAPAAERNLFGVVQKLGRAFGSEVLACRRRNHGLIERLGGRGIHLCAGVPGGWSRAVPESERAELRAVAEANVAFAQASLGLFRERVLDDPRNAELLHSDTYLHRTYSMGTVDADNRLAIFDGLVRVVAPDGRELCKYAPRDYLDHIAERVEPWSYLKFPYLKRVGWKGFVDGATSGVYVASPLARLNVADAVATPRANEHYEELFETFGSKRHEGRYAPVHHRMATHWARLVELLYASERMVELTRDPELTSPDVRRLPERCIGEGTGSVEAPRGTLTHHYRADERGVITAANLVVGTTHNYAAMAMSVKRAASQLIRAGKVVEEGLLNRIEMAFRLYDPCLSCATHSLPGKMPLEVTLRGPDGTAVGRYRRDG